MGASIQRLRHHISRLPFLSFLRDREPVPELPEATDEVAFRFKECEDECGPSAEGVEAKEHERVEQFKRDQLLPIMGWSTGAPG
jgi:hypothetical protein